jgi:hypothetical protein
MGVLKRGDGLYSRPFCQDLLRCDISSYRDVDMGLRYVFKMSFVLECRVKRVE